MATVKAVAKLTVEVYIDIVSLHHAERLLDDWLRNAEEDDRLVAYEVAKSDWVPEWQAPDSSTFDR